MQQLEHALNGSVLSHLSMKGEECNVELLVDQALEVFRLCWINPLDGEASFFECPFSTLAGSNGYLPFATRSTSK